jgi:hypothetical protein
MNLTKEILREYLYEVAAEEKFNIDDDLLSHINKYDQNTFETILIKRRDTLLNDMSDANIMRNIDPAHYNERIETIKEIIKSLPDILK